MRLRTDEIAQHNSEQSCWVIIHGKVYDVTEFLPHHPGGAAVVLEYGGKDATEEYDLIHPQDMIEVSLPPEKCLGEIDPTPLPTDNTPPDKLAPDHDEPETTPLQLMVSLNDFERAAKRVLGERAWIYYSSSSGTTGSFASNLTDWANVTFRPRVLRNVEAVNMQQMILGHSSAAPFFIAPCALARLGHVDGERCLVRGAARFNIPYAVSNASSVGASDLAQCLRDERAGGCLFFQLYVKKDPAETRRTIQEAKSLGYRALMVTVDTAVVGKREEDDRLKSRRALNANPAAGPKATQGSSVPRQPYSSTLSWTDLRWIAQEWDGAGRLCLKGITTVEDARLAAEMGYTALYLSNHGGRQLDGAPSALHTLLEIRRHGPELIQRCEILVDGGVRRGEDALKALALGATAVGLGRPFMYALSTHGAEGVYRAMEILFDEIQTSMRLLGITDLTELRPSAVNTRRLDADIVDRIEDETNLNHPKLAKI
ncbi:FMN-dependent dehydrogenase-domain-containing protein [Aspergillus cavernicola]|uniref:FMN-dependent dehydrogenase-domain-containing protein n=1 Tax=Aspergillus cavernicola TaxID=176166 RepID=A0ABR4I7A5_9EURO